MTSPSKTEAEVPRSTLVVDFKEFSAKTTLFAALSAAYPERPLRRIDAVAAVSRYGTELHDVAARCVDELVERTPHRRSSSAIAAPPALPCTSPPDSRRAACAGRR